MRPTVADDIPKKNSTSYQRRDFWARIAVPSFGSDSRWIEKPFQIEFSRNEQHAGVGLGQAPWTKRSRRNEKTEALYQPSFEAGMFFLNRCCVPIREFPV